MMDNDWNRLKIMLKNSQDEETEMEQKMQINLSRIQCDNDCKMESGYQSLCTYHHYHHYHHFINLVGDDIRRKDSEFVLNNSQHHDKKVSEYLMIIEKQNEQIKQYQLQIQSDKSMLEQYKE